MVTIQQVVELAERSCRTHGSQLTDKRRIVLCSLYRSSKALSAYELVDYCKTAYDEIIPAMSVYRILDFLQDMHLVHKLHMVNKFVVCSDILREPRRHCSVFYVCKVCHRIKEVSVDDSVLKQLDTTSKPNDFEVISPQVELECICSDCISNNQEERKVKPH
ncbi:transcriptional repressor [Vibrio sp.]|nr:transcriptional repressor [Vibrio sp.]